MIVSLLHDWTIDNLTIIPFRTAKLRLFCGIWKFCSLILHFVSFGWQNAIHYALNPASVPKENLYISKKSSNFAA